MQGQEGINQSEMAVVRVKGDNTRVTRLDLVACCGILSDTTVQQDVRIGPLVRLQAREILWLQMG